LSGIDESANFFRLFLIGDREGERETEIAEGMEIKR
jgi:hypothetical protein